ncbi:cobalamin-dependent protein, partial [Brachyspira hampsonii]|uniref:cobalamin-dependent protein n=1 Tax=Brachyspira hampsonii TaxID=1287055 RepID=UPI001CA5083A
MNKINKIYIGYPPFESDRGVALLSQNRQFQWFKSPTYIYPVVPATAATMIKNAGYDVDFVDAIARNMSTKKWYEYLDERTPDLLFFEVKTPVIYKSWKIVDDLKSKYPNMIVVIAGDHVTAMPEETMNNCKVDYLLMGGDYDFLLLNLIEYLNGKAQLEKGIYYRENNSIKNT